jgi:hypothetical protein
LKTHRKTLQQRIIDGEHPHAPAAAAQAFVDGSTTDKPEELALEDESAERAIDADEQTAAEAASVAVRGMPPERFIDAPLNLFQCVYELRITALERETWRKHVAENPPPVLQACLKAQLNIDI